MRLSVVIPMYNAAETIGSTLSSLKEFFDAGDEILVIDDQSRDAGPEIAGRYRARVHSLPNHSGPAAARNRGAHLAGNPWLLFLDSDVVCLPGIRERFLRRIANQDAVQGLYAPLSHDENPVTKYQNNYYHYVFHRISGTETAVCATFFFGVRRDLFLQSGGFDESITDPTVEDEQLGYALYERGHKILLCPELQVVHLTRYSVRSFLLRRFNMARRQANTFLKRKGKQGLLSFLALNLSRKTHHAPAFLLAVALLPPAYFLLLLGFASSTNAAIAVGAGFLGSVFLLNAPLLRALMRLAGKGGYSMPFVFFMDLHVLLAGITRGLLQRVRGSRDPHENR